MSESPQTHIPTGRNLDEKVYQADLISSPEVLQSMYETLTPGEEAQINQLSAELRSVDTIADMEKEIQQNEAFKQMINMAHRLGHHRKNTPVYGNK